MIRISVRDIVADLPPSLIRQRISEQSLIKIEGFENYTPEVRKKLHEMHKAGRIDSHPILSNTGGTILWVTDKDLEDGDYTNADIMHRPNNLPAIEHRDGKSYYRVFGKKHRENGQAGVFVGDYQYFLADKPYTQEQYEAIPMEERIKMRPQKP